MASINGISLKAMKSFEGLEGTAWQGNLYVGTKKIAFWSQDGNGGPDWFDMENGYSKEKLVESMKPYVDQKLVELGIVDEEFMYKLVCLNKTEKEFKKALKKGYKSMMEVTDGFHIMCYYYPDIPACNAEALYLGIEEEIKDKFFKNAKIKYHLYKGLEDFCIGGQLHLKDIKED